MADESTTHSGDNAPPKIKLNLASAGMSPEQIRPAEKKVETTRIDLSQAMPPPAKATVGDTQPVQADSPPAAPEIQKRNTIRIEAPPVLKAETQKVKTETQKIPPRAMSETMRVELAEPLKSETTRINIPAEAFQKKPGSAPRAIPANATDDIFKRATIPVGIPTPPPTPAAKPKTLAVKRPVSPPAEPPPVVAPEQRTVAEAKKSETARLDLPADAGERPATRPKTIRIKRPDSTTARKVLTIARPDAESASLSVSGSATEEESAGTVFSVLALVAVLIACVLIYVLAAQTIAPDLPFPGRV